MLGGMENSCCRGPSRLIFEPGDNVHCCNAERKEECCVLRVNYVCMLHVCSTTGGSAAPIAVFRQKYHTSLRFQNARRCPARMPTTAVLGARACQQDLAGKERGGRWRLWFHVQGYIHAPACMVWKKWRTAVDYVSERLRSKPFGYINVVVTVCGSRESTQERSRRTGQQQDVPMRAAGR